MTSASSATPAAAPPRRGTLPSSTSASPSSSRTSVKGRKMRKSPAKGRQKTPAPSIPTNTVNKGEKEVNRNAEDGNDTEDDEVSFLDHSNLSSRMAKTFYFASCLPSTPRPSLPLTMLAVNAFAGRARKDTLEFLDVEMAAEIGRNACVSPTALIMALIYLDRLSSHAPSYLNSIKPSELFVVSLLVASKFMQDDGEDLGIFNDEWATSAHMELKSLNKLELEFLTAIDWRVNVSKEEYDKVLERLEAQLGLEEGIRRGWFSYTEIGNLSNSLLSWNSIWPTLYEHCVKVITALIATYATLIATLLTSSLLAPHIFLLSKGFITSSMVSLSSWNSVSNICQYPTFSNSTANQIPLALDSRRASEEEMSLLMEAQDLILGDENETDISYLRDIHESYSLPHGASDTKWKNRMSANSRLDVRLLRQNKELCLMDVKNQAANEPPGPWNDEEAFAHYLKHFLELNSKMEFHSDVKTKGTGNGLNYAPPLKCSQELNLNKLDGFPLGSVIRV